jgi:dTDP-4-dehydrorhamnose reductase
VRVAVIGADGQLGSDLVEAFSAAGHEVSGLTHGDIRVEDAASVAAALGGARPEAVLNTAAFHDVPRCEREPERAFSVNALGALNVARAAAELGATAVYYSSDYVFDGAQSVPYVEEDRPNPLNVYAASKLAGEHLTLSAMPHSLTLRVSGLYGKVPCRAKGDNFVSKIVRLAREQPEVRVVTDEFTSPTPTWEIARQTVQLLERGVTGLCHLACEGGCSWHEFAHEIFRTLGITTPLRRASVADFPSPVRRPSYSVLENRRLKRSGLLEMPDWRTSLHLFLRKQYGLHP